MRVSEADKIRLGAQVASVKRRMKAKDWRRLVKGAHARGFTVAGQISGVPDPLKERLRSSLVAEANKTVASAYVPAEANYDTQERKVRALNAKRKSDHAQFQQWLANENAKLESQAGAADAQLATQQSQIAADTEKGYTEAKAAAMAHAGSIVGAVSDPNQAKSMDMSAAAQRASEQVGNQRQATASMTASAKSHQQTSRGVSLGLAVQAESKRESDTNAALSEIAEGRNELKLKRAAAAAEEVRRLFEGEERKADSNRNYMAAAEKLGVESALGEAKLASDSANKAADRKQKARIAAAKLKVDMYRIENSAEQKELDRRLRMALKSKQPAATTAQINLSVKQQGILSQIAADLARWRKKKTKRPLRELATAKGASKVQYELALDLAVHGKLSAINRRRALQLGILNPEDL